MESWACREKIGSDCDIPFRWLDAVFRLCRKLVGMIEYLIICVVGNTRQAVGVDVHRQRSLQRQLQPDGPVRISSRWEHMRPSHKRYTAVRATIVVRIMIHLSLSY